MYILRVYGPEYATYLTSAGGIPSSLGHNLSQTTCTCVNYAAMNKIIVSMNLWWSVQRVYYLCHQ